jgi:carbonic anhydrase
MKKRTTTQHHVITARPLLPLAAALAILAASGAAVLAADKTAPVQPEEALKRLLQGNERFIAGTSTLTTKDARRRTEVAQGQKPFAIVVSCSDSRVGPEVVFDQGLGDLFVVRTAGHVVDDVGLGSIEYAVEHLGASLILVLGHERCGAVAATVSGGETHGHVTAIVKAIKPAVAKAKGRPGDAVDNAVRAQVLEVVGQLQKAGPLLAECVKAGKLKVAGARYDLDAGRVEVIE